MRKEHSIQVPVVQGIIKQLYLYLARQNVQEHFAVSTVRLLGRVFNQYKCHREMTESTTNTRDKRLLLVPTLAHFPFLKYSQIRVKKLSKNKVPPM